MPITLSAFRTRSSQRIIVTESERKNEMAENKKTVVSGSRGLAATSSRAESRRRKARVKSGFRASKRSTMDDSSSYWHAFTFASLSPPGSPVSPVIAGLKRDSSGKPVDPVRKRRATTGIRHSSLSDGPLQRLVNPKDLCLDCGNSHSNQLDCLVSEDDSLDTFLKTNSFSRGQTLPAKASQLACEECAITKDCSPECLQPCFGLETCDAPCACDDPDCDEQPCWNSECLDLNCPELTCGIDCLDPTVLGSPCYDSNCLSEQMWNHACYQDHSQEDQTGDHVHCDGYQQLPCPNQHQQQQPYLNSSYSYGQPHYHSQHNQSNLRQDLNTGLFWPEQTTASSSSNQRYNPLSANNQPWDGGGHSQAGIGSISGYQDAMFPGEHADPASTLFYSNLNAQAQVSSTPSAGSHVGQPSPYTISYPMQSPQSQLQVDNSVPPSIHTRSPSISTISQGGFDVSYSRGSTVPVQSGRPSVPASEIASVAASYVGSSATPKTQAPLICHWVMNPRTGGPHHLCLQQFSTTGEMQAHMQEVHTSKLSKEFRCHWDGCDDYLERDHKQRGKLNRHLRRHTQDYTFECSWEGCTKRFANAQGLQNHMRTHTGEKPFKCRYCEHRCATHTSWTTHERTHTGQKIHKCKEPGCNFVCNDSSNLTKHMKTHKERLYSCPHPGCTTKPTNRFDNMKRHFKESGHCPELLVTGSEAQRQYREVALAKGSK